MTIYLKQSTASQEVALGFFVDSTDGNTEKTGLTIANTDIRLHKTGATTLANPAAGATHISNGIYYWVADATDTGTLGPMTVYCHPTGALAVRVECCVLAANVFDSLIGGGDILDVSTTQWLGTAVSTPTVAGVPNVNVKTWNDLTTVALPLVPTTAGRTLDVSVGGEAGIDWANVGSPTTANALTATTIAVTQKVDVETIKTNPVVNAGTITFPTTATLASTTNITAGTIATVTTLTNLPAITANWLTAAGTAADFGAEIADAVWDEALAGHAGAGSAGEALSAAGTAGDPWTTALPGAYGAGTAGKIVGDNINATISSRLATAGYTAPDNASIAAILVDTAEIGAAGAGLTALASASNLATVAGYLDTEIAAIKAVTDALPNAGALTTIQADLDNIQTRIPAALVGGRMDADLGAIGTSTTALTAFKRAVQGNVIGTVGAASTTTSVVTSSVTPASSTADSLKGRILTFSDDTTTVALRGQSTDITASSASATPILTVTALTTAAVSGDVFSIT